MQPTPGLSPVANWGHTATGRDSIAARNRGARTVSQGGMAFPPLYSPSLFRRRDCPGSILNAHGSFLPASPSQSRGLTVQDVQAAPPNADRVHPFSQPPSSASGASVVAIDNKIEQAMDLVKNHLMYAVREEVEVLKEQIKELLEKNSQLERENSLLKTLASPEQLEKFQSRLPAEVLCPDEQSPGVAGLAQHSGGSAV
ncbi:TSC22 domain family protein 3 isoform X3 [Hirundo rustica]|uniref:TSC22 domain family protein 3 isoform X3 n=1 Tax=Hirundo rustica TaxID=43150 RepID=UPI001A94003F|nr:TSC22 domain family protein 3 isoform X3 [Hirundo rustica]